MRSRSNRWLILGAILLGMGAWLMSQDDEVSVGEAPKIDFPKYLTEDEVVRLQERRMKPMDLPLRDRDSEDDYEAEPRDPLLRAFGAGNNKSILVFEANAIRHSALGEGFLNCLGDNIQNDISRFQNELGLNPLEDIDRMAMGDNTVMFSGHFENFNWQELFETAPIEYGNNAMLFTENSDPNNPDQELTERLALWNNELLIVGKNREDLENTIDTLEGRKAMDSIPLKESETYGEAYGTISTQLLEKLIPEDAGALKEEILKVVSGVQLHTNAMSDVAISAQLTSDGNIEGLSDLGRSMGGALSLALAAARLQGDDQLAQLLEFAKITDNNGELSLDLALPEDYLRRHLDKACSEIIKPPPTMYIDADEADEDGITEEEDYEEDDPRGPIGVDDEEDEYEDDEESIEDDSEVEEVELKPEGPKRLRF